MTEPQALLEASPEPLTQRFDLALLDLDGVVYIGPDVVPGAADALEKARLAGLPVRFVTNNASRPPEVVAEHLVRLGVPAEVDEVVTSAQVAAALLAQRFPAGSGVLIVGAAGLRQAVEEVGLAPMDSVDDGPVAVAQGFDPELGWKRLAAASRAVRMGLFWMATNLDLTVPTPYGPAPGNGSLVHLVATAAGRGPDEVAGKPRPGAFLEAARAAGSARPLVVGDRLDTDLEGAQAADMHGLLVLTGVTGVSELLAATPDCRPTFVGRDLTALLTGHPQARAHRVDGGVEGWCVDARVLVTGDGLSVTAAGSDPLDLLRAGTVAAWAAADAARDDGARDDGARTASPDPAPLVQALRAVEPDAAWAR